MTTERTAPAIPNWLRVVLVVVSAIAVFRLFTLALGFVLYQSGGTFLPLSIQEFLYRWDMLLVPLAAVTAAVLSARRFESKLAHRNFPTAVLTCLGFAAVAFCPWTVRFEAKPVMASPVIIAMQNNYSLETIETILERYPHLANASEDDWGRIQPLVEAAYERRTNLVELLIRKGADLDSAVATLMQLQAEDAVKLVLQSAESHKQAAPENGSQPFRSETNSTSSAGGSRRSPLR